MSATEDTILYARRGGAGSRFEPLNKEGSVIGRLGRLLSMVSVTES